MMNVEKWYPLCWSAGLLCLLLLSGHARAQDSGKVSLFVTGDTAKHERAATWVEGIWVNIFHKRLQDAEVFLGARGDQVAVLNNAEKAFLAGKKAYEDLNPDLAFRKFRESIGLFESGASYLWDMNRVSQAWLYLGVSYLLSGKRLDAEKSFLQALIINPTADIKSVTTEADKVKVFKQVEQQIGLAPVGTLEIRTTPYASVYINGKLAGAAPVRLRLRRGKHFVMVRREGYKHWGKVVSVTGQTARFSMTLAPLNARSNWLQSGKLATQSLKPQSSLPTGVAAFGTLSQSRYVLLAKVKFLPDGKRIKIVAAAYDVVSKKQLASGGAVAGWGTEPDIVKKLGEQLLAGNSVRLGGWQTIGRRPPPPPKKGGSKAGLAVGLTIGLLVLAGGGVVLGLYLTGNLTGPQCPDTGSCVEIKLE
ncbi:MAG: PEGA domain-containing protein [Deltaproteobacteria bacterium]|nr:MAG: PEGA domain-containing protein [Deltaproteobacteria bacterium]